jgi:hypothetical protein
MSTIPPSFSATRRSTSGRTGKILFRTTAETSSAKDADRQNHLPEQLRGIFASSVEPTVSHNLSKEGTFKFARGQVRPRGKEGM